MFAEDAVGSVGLTTAKYPGAQARHHTCLLYSLSSVSESASKSCGLTSLRYPTSLHPTPPPPLFKPLSSCVLTGAVPPESPCLYSFPRLVHCPRQLTMTMASFPQENGTLSAAFGTPFLMHLE